MNTHDDRAGAGQPRMRIRTHARTDLNDRATTVRCSNQRGRTTAALVFATVALCDVVVGSSFLGGFFSVGGTAAFAQPVPSREPSSSHIFPAGARRGTKVAVRVGGECIPPGARLIFTEPTVRATETLEQRLPFLGEPSPRRKPTEIPINYPKEWAAELEVAADAPLGTKLWRIACAQGGSGGRPFIVGDLPEWIETESNSTPDRAERIAVPITVNGQISGERDVDYYEVELAAGQLLACELIARRIGSPLDANLELFDSQGQPVDLMSTYLGSDRAVAFVAREAGRYRLRVSNVSFHGSPAHVYRLNLTTQPIAVAVLPGIGAPDVVFTFPASPANAPSANGATPVNIATPANAASPAAMLFDSIAASMVSSAAAGELAGRVQRGELSYVQLRETDATTRASQATETPRRMTAPLLVDGQAARHEFIVALEAGRRYSIACDAVTRTDDRVAVRVVGEDGATLVQLSARDVMSGKRRLEWQPPKTGDYRLVVQAVPGGGELQLAAPYRLLVEPARAEIELSVPRDVLHVVQGGAAEWEVTVERRGEADGEVELTVDNLPAGVTVQGTKIAAKQRSTKLKFTAAADAPSTSATIAIRGRVTVGEASSETSIEAMARGRHLGRDEEGTSLGAGDAAQLQLNVQHKPLFRLYCAEAYQYAHRGSIYPYLMEIERLNGFDGEITVQLGDRQNRDLDGIEMLETKLGPQTKQFAMPIYLPETMHINVQSQSQLYTQAYARFVDAAGKPQSLLVVSEKRNMLRTLPPVVRLTSVDERVRPVASDAALCRLKLERTSNFTGPMRIELISAPPGVTLIGGSQTIPADASEIEVELFRAAGATVPPGARLRFRATGLMPAGAKAVTEAEVAW